jgi:zinc transport system permease protein
MIIETFILTALLAGMGVAMMAGPLGCVMVWKRMAFFGDALSHSALLGVALGMLAGIHLTLGIVIATLCFSLVLALSLKQRSYSSDTMLGILAHATLAFGLVVISLANIRVDLTRFLFGDILSVHWQEVGVVYAGATLTFILLYFLWKPLVLMTINRDLAQVEGVNTLRVQAQFMVLIALLVALSVKIVGVLLVTSLLIIPAATARLFASTPEKMAFFASLCGCLSVVLGVLGSMQWDIPTGPAIVVAATLLFIAINVFKRLRV